LFGLGMDQPVRKDDVSKGDRVCPACQMRFSDYRKTSRLGCPRCYETFSEDLAPALAGMHRGRLVHCGKIPSGRNARLEVVKTLQSSLEDAVSHQNFEEAARIRDQLHAKNTEPNGPGGVA
jgi:protein arginine kinase activator